MNCKAGVDNEKTKNEKNSEKTERVRGRESEIDREKVKLIEREKKR